MRVENTEKTSKGMWESGKNENRRKMKTEKGEKGGEKERWGTRYERRRDNRRGKKSKER